MKMFKLNLKLVVVVIATGLFFANCENDSVSTEQISSEEALSIVEADDATDDVNNLIDDFFVAEDLAGKSEDASQGMPDCITKTIVLTNTTKTVTLDFGDGCEMPNGNVLKGKIIMSYAIDTSVASFTVTYTYENFFFNDLSIEGQNSMVRVRENANGNPQSTLTVDITVTWPDGNFAKREGTKVREWIAGADTRHWGDNVFLITGNWKSTFRNGTVFSATIVEPLRKEMACRFIVSGIVDLQKNERTGSLNYGDGSCDNKAIFTNGAGEETEVTLRGRWI